MPDDEIMLTLSPREWAWIVTALRTQHRQATHPVIVNELTSLIDKLADRLDLDLEKLDG